MLNSIFLLKMKKEIFHNIEIPNGVEAEVDGNILKVSGKNGENKRKFDTNKLIFEKKDNKIIIGCKKATKAEKRVINTILSHIMNMISGVQKKFEYKLKICHSHFPITVKIEEKKAIIKNFLGEKVDRQSKIPDGVDVKLEKDLITVTSIDKELAGQTAANFETATRIKKRDRRVFQDGIFIINKSGKKT